MSDNPTRASEGLEALGRRAPVSEDIPMQRRMWRAQRYGWILLAIILAFALMGAFGQGPLATATVSAGDVRVHYERIGRWESGMTMRIAIARPPAGKIGMRLSPKFAEFFQIQGIEPRPIRSLAGGDIEYEFAQAAGDFSAILHLRARKWGFARIPISIGPHALEMDYLILP